MGRQLWFPEEQMGGNKFLAFLSLAPILHVWLLHKDREGSITCAKLGQVMQTLGWKPSEMELKVTEHLFFALHALLQELVGVIDQDGNGVITFNEFGKPSNTSTHIILLG